MEEFIDTYTMDEVNKIKRHNRYQITERFKNTLKAQKMAALESQGQVERKSITSSTGRPRRSRTPFDTKSAKSGGKPGDQSMMQSSQMSNPFNKTMSKSQFKLKQNTS